MSGIRAEDCRLRTETLKSLRSHVQTSSHPNSVAGGRAQRTGAACGRPHRLPTRCLPRAQIILSAAAGQTDGATAQDLGLAIRTVWLWRRRFAQQRLDGLKDRPKCPPPRLYHADIQARLLVLAWATQTRPEVTPGRGGYPPSS
ncbi:MAG TPA: helix-turn-helix domain-containing protein [Chloroflexota bacterium]